MQATCRWEVISPFALRWLLERLPPSLCLLCRFCLLLSPPLRPSQKCRGERPQGSPLLYDGFAGRIIVSIVVATLAVAMLPATLQQPWSTCYESLTILQK